jgi:hypothetical protein
VGASHSGLWRTSLSNAWYIAAAAIGLAHTVLTTGA